MPATRSTPVLRKPHLLASLALAALTAPLIGAAPASPAQSEHAVDVAALIDGAASGDSDVLIAALPRVTEPGPAALLRARIAALALDSAGAREALAAYFASGDADPRRRAIALSLAVDMDFSDGDYAGAAKAGADWLAGPDTAHLAGERDSMAQTAGVARALAGVPRQHVAGGTPESVDTHRDKAGLIRAGVTVNGAAEDAVLDTGANLSVVSMSTARRLGMRILEEGGSVSDSTGRSVATQFAVADKLEIAGVTIEHVVFLVLDDARLSFPIPGGYSIDVILGFPVFRALGRVEFDRAGRFTVGGASSGGAAGSLRAAGSDLYVAAQVNAMPVALHLDTGALHTALHARFAREHAELVAGLPKGKRNSGGASGIVEQAIATWKPVTIAVNGRSTTLDEVDIVTDKVTDSEGRLGVIGQDVLGAFQSYAIDFRTMSFEFGPPVAR